MLKVLIKKQFFECFKGYFINSKTGKAKSKASRIGTFILFGFVMLILATCFLGLATTVAELLNTQFSWLYYALFGLITVGLGTFASVFNTSSSLYNAKDNDLLLSMPIKPQLVLISRVTLVYGLSLLYSSMVWLPICAYALIFYKFSVINLILDILLLFIITILTTVISCLLGYIVASITRKVKNKSITTAVLSLLFMAVYYLICFRLESLMQSLITNASNIANIVSTWGYLLYQLALAADGNILAFAIVTIVNCILGFVCYKILTRNYVEIITSSKDVQAKSSKVVYKNQNSIEKTLLIKEAKRFVGTPIYLLNCGLGTIMVLVAAVALFIKRNDIVLALDAFRSFMPEVDSFVPLLIIGIVTSIIGLDNIAAPSISLEGKNLWILKSLPISTYKILDAKKKLQLIINLIPSIIASLIMCFALKLDYSSTLYVLVVVMLFEEMHSCIGVLLSLVNPNFTWTTETQPVKQDLKILFSMLISLLLTALIVVPYYFLRKSLYIRDYFEILIIIMAVVVILLRRSIRIWGVSKFESL